MEQIARKQPPDIVPYAETVVNNLPQLLEPNTPRKLLDTTKVVWTKINTVMPRE